jgi:hypothetical protein
MDVIGQLHAPATLPPGKEHLISHWIGGWVGLRPRLDALVKRKTPSYCQDSNPRSSSLYPSAIPMGYPEDVNPKRKNSTVTEPNTEITIFVYCEHKCYLHKKNTNGTLSISYTKPISHIKDSMVIKNRER